MESLKHIKSITSGVEQSQTPLEITRKIYLTYPTNALEGKEEEQFEILNEISDFFKIPIINIHVVGSAKLGCSLIKDKLF